MQSTSLIPKDTVLCDSNNHRWIVGDPLDIDGSRDVYAVALFDDNVPNYKSAAIFKTHSYDPQLVVDLCDHESTMISDICNLTAIEGWKEKKNLRHLGVTPILGSGYYAVHGTFYSYIVTQWYAENLQQLFKKKKKGFILPTIYKLVGQMINVLEYIHSLGYYNEFYISSGKLLLGFNDPNNIYLDVINYGRTPDCLIFKSRHAQVGTASGDLESILYMAFHWMKLEVPWNDSMDDVTINVQKEKAFDNFEEFLKVVFGKFQVLAPIHHFMKELASTVSANEPNYDKIRLFLSNGIRNIRNVNHNLDGAINYKAELNLRKKKIKYVNPIVKKVSNISSYKVDVKTKNKSSMKKSKNVLKKKKKIRCGNNQVKSPSPKSNRDGLEINNTMQVDNLQKASLLETTAMNNTTEPTMDVAPIAETIASAASLANSVAKSRRSQDDALEMTMTSKDSNSLLPFDESAKASQNVTVMSITSTTSIKKLHHSEMTEPELMIISSNTLQRAKRNNQEAEESTKSSRCKRTKVVSTETDAGETQVKSTGTESLKEKQQQQQLAATSTVSYVINDRSSNDPEENLARMNSDSPDKCNTGIDSSGSAIQQLDKPKSQISRQMQDLQKKFELLESKLESCDTFTGSATEGTEMFYSYIQAVKKQLSYHKKTFNFLRCQFLAWVPKAHQQKISITELWNKMCCVDYRIKELEDSINKIDKQICRTKPANVKPKINRNERDVNTMRKPDEKTQLSKEVRINFVRYVRNTSCATNSLDYFSNKKSLENSAGSTDLQIVASKDEECKRREEELKNKSEEKSGYGQVTMEQDLVHYVQERVRQKEDHEKNGRNAKLDIGLKHVEDIAIQLNRDTQGVKKSLTKNLHREDKERVLRVYEKSDITIEYVQKKK